MPLLLKFNPILKIISYSLAMYFCQPVCVFCVLVCPWQVLSYLASERGGATQLPKYIAPRKNYHLPIKHSFFYAYNTGSIQSHKGFESIGFSLIYPFNHEHYFVIQKVTSLKLKCIFYRCF